MSQDGANPDPDNDGDPGDDNEPTEILFPLTIPTLGEWGLLVMIALLSLTGLLVVRRRA